MERREFIKSIGIAGIFSLLATVPSPGFSNRPIGREKPDPEPLSGPFAAVFDPSGNLLVTDPSHYRVVCLDSNEKPLFSFGGPGSGPGMLNYPLGIAVDSTGVIFVADSNNCRIQSFDSNGDVKGVIGSIGSTAGSFANPQGIAFDKLGRLVVADTRNHRLQIFQRESLVGVVGELGDDNDQFRLPTAVIPADKGEILVLDSKHGLVKFFGEDLKFKRSFAGVGSSPGLLNTPQAMALDESGNIWVADTGNHRIQEFSPDGKLISLIGKPGAGPDEFKNPTGITIRGEKVCVADNGNGRLQFLARK